MATELNLYKYKTNLTGKEEFLLPIKIERSSVAEISQTLTDSFKDGYHHAVDGSKTLILDNIFFGDIKLQPTEIIQDVVPYRSMLYVKFLEGCQTRNKHLKLSLNYLNEIMDEARGLIMNKRTKYINDNADDDEDIPGLEDDTTEEDCLTQDEFEEYIQHTHAMVDQYFIEIGKKQLF
jgi:hypothetical protein